MPCLFAGRQLDSTLREQNMRFQDKVVLVTGAGRGMGKKPRAGHAAEGAKLVVLSKNPEIR